MRLIATLQRCLPNPLTQEHTLSTSRSWLQKKIASKQSALLIVLCCSHVVSVQAEQKSFCFAMAESYYEQLYCEIQAKGEGKNLPPLYQFKENPEATQALLLKRPAAKIGVKVVTPNINQATKKANIALPSIGAQASAKPTSGSTEKRKSNQASTIQAVAKQQAAKVYSNPTIVTNDSGNCALKPREILCQHQRYALLTNRHNRHLSGSALGPENRMLLPVYSGSMSDEAAVRDYLYRAYEQYLNQMHSIGLAGVTTRFSKFSYLFYDYHDKGLNFVDRFETLFHYLKKDKASLGVSEQPADSEGMSLNQCAQLSDRYFICEHGKSNLIYAKQ